MHVITSGFGEGANDGSWEWTAFTADVAAWTNSTETAASCALSHEGGRNPCPLNSVFALHMHIKRVKKTGWRQRRKGCSPRIEKSCCVPWGQTRKGLATCRGNEAKLHSLLPAVDTMETANLWLNRTTLTTCGCSTTIKANHFISRGSCSVAEGVQSASLLWNPNSPRKHPLQNFKTQKPSQIFSAESCRLKYLFLNKRAHHVAVWVPRTWSLEYLIVLVCGVHWCLIFLGLHCFNCKLCNSAHSSCPICLPFSVSFF